MNQLGVARGVDIQMNELDTCDTSLAWKSMDARHNATTHDAIFPSPFFNFDPMQQVLILRIAKIDRYEMLLSQKELVPCFEYNTKYNTC